MKGKRVLATGLIVILAMAGFTGCNFSPKEQKENGDFPVLTWYVPKENPKDKQMVMDAINKITEEKIGVHLDMQFIDGGAYDDRMTMQFASGKEMDLCFTSDWANNVITAVQKGALAEIDSLIDEHAPKLREVIPAYLFDSTKVNGKIYAIPNQQVLFRQQALVIFNDLASKYGFDPKTVKTVPDIEPYLKIIKDNEPGIYPYARTTSEVFTTDYERINPGNSGILIRNDKTENVEAMIVENVPEYREGIRIFNDWYKKGYIRQDINTVLNTDAEILAGKYAVADTVYKPGVEVEWKLKTGRDVTVIPLGEPTLSANSGMSTMTAIPRTSKNKEKAIKLLELMQTDKELYNLLAFGIEGTHYTRIDDKYIKPDKDSGYYLNAAWMFGNQFNAYLMEGQQEDVWEKTQQMNNDAVKSPISGFLLDTEPIKTELSQVSTVRKEYQSVDNGTEDDAVYAEYLEKLDEAGQQKIKEEVQKQIDAFLKK